MYIYIYINLHYEIYFNVNFSGYNICCLKIFKMYGFNSKRVACLSIV